MSTTQATILEEIAQEIATCQKCPLARSRTRTVPGEGNPQALVMFVGEGPGIQEDRQGRPFVGPAGQLLNQLLLVAGLRRPDVFITNVVKCRPPENRTPAPEEVAACSDYLDAQIAVISPRIICPLGSPALKRLLSEDLAISKVHGTAFRRTGILYMPLYHPAAALHKDSLRQPLHADMVKLRDLLARELA